MARAWKDQCVEEFFEYFRLAYPNAYPYRKHKTIMMWGLAKGGAGKSFVSFMNGVRSFFGGDHIAEVNFTPQQIEQFTREATDANLSFAEQFN